MESPKISVCIFCYNYDIYIEQAINSVLNQKTNFNYKLFLGEDCSTYNTSEICQKLKKISRKN